MCAAIVCWSAVKLCGGVVVTKDSSIQEVSPRGVSVYLNSVTARCREQVSLLKSAYGEEFEPEVTVNYVLELKAFQKVKGPLWVVGLSLGVAPGNGLVPINKTSIIDATGKEILSIKDEYAGERAVILPLTSDIVGLAVLGDSGRPHNGWIKVI